MSLMACNAINLVGPLILFFIFAQRLGAEGFGRFVLWYSLSLYLAIIVDWGLNQWALLRYSASADPEHDLGHIWSTLVITRSAIFSVLLSGLAGLTMMPSALLDPVAWAMLVNPLGLALFPAWYLQGCGRYGLLAAATAFGRFASILAGVTLVVGPSDIAAALVCSTIAPMLSAALVLVLEPRLLRLRLTSLWPAMVIDNLKSGFPFLLTSLITSVYTLGITLTIGQIAGSASAGYFALADRVRTFIQFPITAIVTAGMGIYPKARVADAEKADRFLATIAVILTILYVAAAISICFLADGIVALLAGGTHGATAEILRVICFASALVALNGLIGNVYFASRGLARFIPVCVFVGSLVCVGISIGLYSILGLVGFAWGVIAAEAAVLLSFLTLSISLSRKAKF
jgi:O-antigen/teichoic acid export membrane protein